MHLSIGLLPVILATLTAARPDPSVFDLRRQGSNDEVKAKYEVKEPPLTTPWTYKVGTNPWPEYPRPQLERSKWQNLNGIWRYQKAKGSGDVESPPPGDSLPEEVLIPSCLESGLSGELRNESLCFCYQITNSVVCRYPGH